MQYKSIKEQNEIIISILKRNKELMSILTYVEKLKLPNFYISAGSIFQTVWNYYDNKPLNYGIKDIDIIYFNKKDLSVDTDLMYYRKVKAFADKQKYNYEIDVSNEARMHIMHKEKYNNIIEPYISSEDAINKWIATVHSIGITKTNDEIKIYAPYGLSDIFSRTIRPIKHKDNSKELYDKKVNSWKERFDNLNIIEW
ncbi:MAG: nucleotidyltransferase family protein [Clostridia bacterium]|nr:nucleotidyltransferase family protein [Clostridia bacterium]